MTKRTYPRKVWILKPSFKPVEITVITQYRSYNDIDHGDVSESGKLYTVSEMFDSKMAAIIGGRARLDAQQEKLKKKFDEIVKKYAVLFKAENNIE